MLRQLVHHAFETLQQLVLAHGAPALVRQLEVSVLQCFWHILHALNRPLCSHYRRVVSLSALWPAKLSLRACHLMADAMFIHQRL